MTCCNTLLPSLQMCGPNQESKIYIDAFVKVLNDKFINFLVKQGIEIVAIAETGPNKRFYFKDEFNVKIEYQAYNMDGNYYLFISQKKLIKIHETIRADKAK